MTSGNDETRMRIGVPEGNTARQQAEETLLKAGALQRAIFNTIPTQNPGFRWLSEF
jgi:hypothetical protein